MENTNNNEELLKTLHRLELKVNNKLQKLGQLEEQLQEIREQWKIVKDSNYDKNVMLFFDKTVTHGESTKRARMCKCEKDN